MASAIGAGAALQFRKGRQQGSDSGNL